MAQDAERPLAVRRQERGILGDQLERPGDVGEGGAELVRDERDELRLEPVHLAQLLVGPRQLGIGRGEFAPGLVEVRGPLLDDRLEVPVDRLQFGRGRLVGDHQSAHPAEGDGNRHRTGDGEKRHLAEERQRERFALENDVLADLDREGHGRQSEGQQPADQSQQPQGAGGRPRIGSGIAAGIGGAAGPLEGAHRGAAESRTGPDRLTGGARRTDRGFPLSRHSRDIGGHRVATAGPLGCSHRGAEGCPHE